MTKILVVDDDPSISEVLRLYLTFEGYEVLVAANGEEALKLFDEHQPDLLVLDIMLPRITGWEVCSTVRKHSRIPILMLTAKDSTEDKLHGFAMGADDYLIKPFDPKEAVARIKALLRRTGTKEPPQHESVIRIGQMEINPSAYEVKLHGQQIMLKPREMQLLHFLLQNQNRVFTREQLLETVWGYDYAGETRTVDVHIKRLRQKVEIKDSPIRLRTVWSVGYKLEVVT